MSAHLPPAFLHVPLAHRAFHGTGAPENSRAAVRRAVAAGYGIEIDVQLTSDARAIVFHDDLLDRLTPASGPVRAITAAEASAIPLTRGDETIPSLGEVLDIVGGKVPLLIEVKDQDGDMGPGVGPLEAATVSAIDGYAGDVALMSFNPFSVAELARRAPERAVGLVSQDVDHPLSGLSEKARDRTRNIAPFEECGASFISHQAIDLETPRVAELKAKGVPVLCWTIRSEAEERAARQIAQNITFEGYDAALPA